MLSITKIAVIGGSGKSGQFLIRELIQQNISFRLLARNTASINLPHGELTEGDVRDRETVLKLVESCTAIISTLGQPKSQSPVFSQATSNVLAAMEVTNISRYIVTTGLNVDTPLDKKGPVTQAGTHWMKEHYPDTTADKQREYELLFASKVDWTLVRLPLIGLTEECGDIITDLEDCPGSGIHGVDLARFLVRQIKDTSYLRQAPFLANRPKS